MAAMSAWIAGHSTHFRTSVTATSTPNQAMDDNASED
jgi:hypothetical protein